MVPRFKQMLFDNQELDMTSQKGVFIKTLEEWINYPSDRAPVHGQIDDIILLGIQI